MPFSLLEQNSKQALVVSKSRRKAQIITADQKQLPAVIPGKLADTTVGDLVLYRLQGKQVLVSSILQRRNCLSRTYRKKVKTIAANLDMVFIVSAVQPLFNTSFVDRVIAVCHLQQIPHTLIVNKIDLDLEETQPLIDIYQKLGINVECTSTKISQGLAGLQKKLEDPSMKIVVLAGVSGVGKSSILNQLVPHADRKTSQVSKTGQGRQTTSQSVGYIYKRDTGSDVLIIDLPGVQNFGVSNLNQREVADAFVEFSQMKHLCEYADCFHRAEPNCAVKDAVARDQVSESRYLSYLNMLQEIEDAREY